MACESSYLGDDNLQLIDFSKEDDYLVAYPFRDSLEDLRLSVTFDSVIELDHIKRLGALNSGKVVDDSQVVEGSNHIQFESMEPKRPSFLRKSLAWDGAFFTSAGVLDPEELFMINKGFKKAESHRISPGIQKDVPPHRASDQEHKSLNSKCSSLKTLEGKLFKDEKPNIHKLSKTSKAASDIVGTGFSQVNAIFSKKTNIFPQNKVKSVRIPKSQSPGSEGKSLQATIRSSESYSSSPMLLKKISRAKPISTRLPNEASLEEADYVKSEYKTRKAGSVPDLMVFKRSRWEGLSAFPKSTSFMSPTTEKGPKVHYSYESSSKCSSTSTRRKTTPRNTKPAKCPLSLHVSLTSTSTSTCSSSTSPASSTDKWSSESLSTTSLTNHNLAGSLYRTENCLVDNAIQALDYQSYLLAPSSSPCEIIEGRKFTSQCATKASKGTTPILGGPKRKIKSSGLRMPSPKIGFFDKEQPLQSIFKGSMQFRFGGQSPLPNGNKCVSSNLSPQNHSNVGKTFNGEHDRRRSSRFKPNGQRIEVISKNKPNVELKGNKGLPQEVSQKENVHSFDDRVNGLSKYFDIIDLNRDVDSEGKGQLSFTATAESITPCSRTPLAEMFFKQ